jgi:hypothetical protein
MKYNHGIERLIRWFSGLSKSMRFRIGAMLLAPAMLLVSVVASDFPQYVELWYSNTINKLTRQFLSIITGIVPFSVAEFLVITLFIVLFILLIMLVVKILKGGVLNHLITIAAYLSVLYILFLVTWGFNYSRFSFDRIAGLEIRASSKEELYALCEELIIKANELRKDLEEDENGVMTIPGGYRDVMRRAELGYKEAAKVYRELGGRYGRPKGILLSEALNYTGISGIYIPYTAEANVNIRITDLMLPSTTAHEMAHQRGFAREDEANYIAYLVCSMHPDKDFQYSGVMLSLIYSMNAMARRDIEAFRELRDKYLEGVRRDLQHERDFWVRYEGRAEQISTRVNDTYLRYNGQEDGVQSYGRMVDLLLAEFRQNR